MRLILVIALSLMALPSWANQLKSVRVWPSPDNTRVVLDMSSAPNYNYFTLTGPNRLVIDLKGASNVTNLARIENKSELVRKIRDAQPELGVRISSAFSGYLLDWLQRGELELAASQWVFFESALRRPADEQGMSAVATTSERLLSVMDRLTGLYEAALREVLG